MIFFLASCGLLLFICFFLLFAPGWRQETPAARLRTGAISLFITLGSIAGYAHFGAPGIIPAMEKYAREKQSANLLVAKSRQAVLASNGAPEAILHYAKALILSAGGVITPESKKSLEMVILQSPDNLEAQFLLALEHAQQGDKSLTIKALNRLLPKLPADSPLRAAAEEELNRLENAPE